MKQDILIGCVADDFTGASDAASFLMSKGMKTILFNGKPDGEIPPVRFSRPAAMSRSLRGSVRAIRASAGFLTVRAGKFR